MITRGGKEGEQLAESTPVAPNEIALAGFRDERDSFLPLLAGILVAVVLHAGIATTTELTPPKKMAERIEMTVYKPPPKPPPPPPPPPPPKEKPPPPPPPPPPPSKKPPPPPPPPSNQPPPPEPPKAPVPVVTGISMSSTVKGDSGFQVRVGNTTYGDPNKEKFVDPKEVKPYQGGQPGFKAARASTITREARVVKDYKGPYPRDLSEQGVEGAVVALVEVTKDGGIRNVRLAKSSGNGTLDRLALDYIKRFRFDAAQVDGKPVDSILRYTYRFELYD